MTSLRDAGMRYHRASLGNDELQQMRDFQRDDPRVEFLSVFPVSPSNDNEGSAGCFLRSFYGETDIGITIRLGKSRLSPPRDTSD